jgi:hypothetical protein
MLMLAAKREDKDILGGFEERRVEEWEEQGRAVGWKRSFVLFERIREFVVTSNGPPSSFAAKKKEKKGKNLPEKDSGSLALSRSLRPLRPRCLLRLRLPRIPA